MSDTGTRPPGPADPAADDPHDALPAQALAEVWELLDVLPGAAASPDMMATTMEMAAAPAAAARGAEPSGGWDARGWLPAAAIVLAALGVGIAAGRATAPNPDKGILGLLPFVQHLDLLTEAGSVAFLEEVAKRDYPAPRRPPPARSPADVEADAQEFDAAVASFRGHRSDGDGKDVQAARRAQVLAMPERERRQLDKSVEAFLRLSAADRRELVALGRALADPSRRRLLEAARLWHLWIQFRDPADRRDVIDLSTADRLEWLDRITRLDARLEGRGEALRQYFERDPRRRPPQGPRGPDFMQPGPPGMVPRPRGPIGPGGPGPRGSDRGPQESRRPEGREQQDARGPGAKESEGGERTPVSPGPPRPPAETPAPPR